MSEQTTPRPLAIRFAGRMEEKLRENDHKSGWLPGPRSSPHERSPLGHFRDKLREECEELLEALDEEASVSELVMEAADVANIAAMMDDRARFGYYDDSDQEDRELSFDSGKPPGMSIETEGNVSLHGDDVSPAAKLDVLSSVEDDDQEDGEDS